jgi:outer membrane protein assembly factor BamB
MTRIVPLLLPLLLAADWPRFLGPNGDGTIVDPLVKTAWPKGGPPVLWTASLGNGYAPASAAGGKLYHFDRHGDANRLTCRDLLTGKELWHREYATGYEDQYGFDNGPRCCPVIHDGRVVVYGPEGTLAAFAVADGKPLWQVDTVKQYKVVPNFFGVASVPVVEGGLLLVAVGGSPPGRPADFSLVKPNGSMIVAFDPATGQERWRGGDDLASYASPTVVTMHGKRLGLYFARSGLVGFDPANGKTLFRHPWRARILESVNAANPVVAGDTILISESYEIGSTLLRWTGEKLVEVWSDREKDRFDVAMKAHWCTPVRHGDFVYGCSSRHSPEADLRCVELKTGDVKWTLKRTQWQTLVMVNDQIVALGEHGEIRVFRPNAAKYDEIAKWETDLPHPAWAPPTVADGVLFVRGRGKLIAYDLRK